MMTKRTRRACIGIVSGSLLIAGGAIASATPIGSSRIDITVVPGQNPFFVEGSPGTLKFTISNSNQNVFDLLYGPNIAFPGGTQHLSPSAVFSHLTGDTQDVAHDPAIAAGQCQGIAAINLRTQTPGKCTLTVTFSTTDASTAPESKPPDIDFWRLTVAVAAQKHGSTDTPQWAATSADVGVKDLPEPSTLGLLGFGLVAITAGALRGLRADEPDRRVRGKRTTSNRRRFAGDPSHGGSTGDAARSSDAHDGVAITPVSA